MTETRRRESRGLHDARAKRRLRVLHVIDSLTDGGAEQNLLTLVRHLPASEYEHHLAWLYPNDRLLTSFAPHVVSTLGLRAGPNFGLARASLRLARYMRAVGPHLVSAKLIRAQLVARSAAALVGFVPVVSTWECVSYAPDMYAELGRRGPWLRKLNLLMDAATGLFDARFIAVSKEVAEHNARALCVSSGRVTVIYNAFDPNKIVDVEPARRDELRRELGVGPGQPLLLSVGRLVEQKDHATSIRAMAHVVRSIPGVVLAIAGAGSLGHALERGVEALGLLGKVRLLGPRTDVPALLRAADLFISSSRFEGHSVALMEALAAELPAVLSRIQSYVEVLADSPAVRYFEPGDAEGLATVIAGAIADLPDLRRAAVAQAVLVRDRFGPEVMAKQYDRLFREAARPAPRA